MLGRERGEVGTAGSGRGQQQPGGDPRVTHVLARMALRSEDAGARCWGGCRGSLAGAESVVSERRQVVDLPPVPASVVPEYQLLSRTCPYCGAVSTAAWSRVDDVNPAVVTPAGSPVRIWPRTLGMRVSDPRAPPVPIDYDAQSAVACVDVDDAGRADEQVATLVAVRRRRGRPQIAEVPPSTASSTPFT